MASGHHSRVCGSGQPLRSLLDVTFELSVRLLAQPRSVTG